jgi:hypothetical protein
MREELRRRSRWMMRVREWDDRAQYPNIWNEGMPCQILAVERVAGRLRLGDLIAVYYPNSQRHPDRSGRFVGISRVRGLRAAAQQGFAWVELETAHRFDQPLDLKRQPGRVFLCCDPGWPRAEVSLFTEVFEAAVRAGWRPGPEELAPQAADSGLETPPRPAVEPSVAAPSPADHEQAPAAGEASPDNGDAPPAEASRETEVTPGADETSDARPELAEAALSSDSEGRLFGGVDYSGDMRDPRKGTWLATLSLLGDRLKVTRLEPTGRSGLEGYLRDPDRALMNVEAIGLDFPFSLPVSFAELLLGGPFPEEGWWALAKRLERLTRPEYLTRVHEFRDTQGESRRLTDERAEAYSPLRRISPDLGSRAFHGIRMIAEDRSRFAMRPFESAQGKLLLEVYPDALVRRIAPSEEETDRPERLREIVSGLSSLRYLPVDLDGPFRRSCLSRRDALDAVIAARSAAVAVLTGEADRGPDELAPGHGARVRCEGWIYGLEEPA